MMIAISTVSMIPAHVRIQNPAYSKSFEFIVFPCSGQQSAVLASQWSHSKRSETGFFCQKIIEFQDCFLTLVVMFKVGALHVVPLSILDYFVAEPIVNVAAGLRV
jgi:hypothetical protein